jgi:hypothetical protein
MLENATIFMIRHGEKPKDAIDSDAELALAEMPGAAGVSSDASGAAEMLSAKGGKEHPCDCSPELMIEKIGQAPAPAGTKVVDRCLAPEGYARAAAYTVYLPCVVRAVTGGKIDWVFASEGSNASCRPCLTVQPLAQAIGQGDPLTPAKDKDLDGMCQALEDPKYRGCHIVICWHHGQILQLAHTLGVDPAKLPLDSHWPSEPWPADVFGWLLQLTYDGDGNIIPEQTRCINERLMAGDCGQEPPLAPPTPPGGIWTWNTP